MIMLHSTEDADIYQAIFVGRLCVQSTHNMAGDGMLGNGVCVKIWDGKPGYFGGLCVGGLGRSKVHCGVVVGDRSDIKYAN